MIIAESEFEEPAKYAAMQERLAFKIKIEAISESKFDSAIVECVLKSEQPASDNIFNILETICDEGNIIRAAATDLVRVISREAIPEDARLQTGVFINIRRVHALQTAASLKLAEFYVAVQNPDKNKETLERIFSLYSDVMGIMNIELINNNLEFEEDRIKETKQ